MVNARIDLQSNFSHSQPTKENQMTKVLVLYYSAWGHMEAMAYAAAEGAKEAVQQLT